MHRDLLNSRDISEGLIGIDGIELIVINTAAKTHIIVMVISYIR